jgi:hypothetical protein
LQGCHYLGNPWWAHICLFQSLLEYKGLGNPKARILWSRHTKTVRCHAPLWISL